MIVKVSDLVPCKTRPLEVVDVAKLSEDEFWFYYVCKHQPLIIKGGIKHWPAHTKWGKREYLESITTNSNAKVAFRRSFNSNPPPPHFEKMNLKDAIKEMQELSDDETFGVPAMRVPQEWKKDIGGYPFFKNRESRKPIFYQLNRLFLFKNASTDWHTHPADETISSQIVGSKRVSMFRCTEKDYDLYAPYIEANLHHMSLAEQYFPKESNLIKFEGVLEQGDSIYIPPFWWHGFDSNDTNFGITLARCFRSPMSRVGAFNEPVLKDLKKYTTILQQLMVSSLIAISTLSRILKGEKW